MHTTVAVVDVSARLGCARLRRVAFPTKSLSALVCLLAFIASSCGDSPAVIEDLLAAEDAVDAPAPSSSPTTSSSTSTTTTTASTTSTTTTALEAPEVSATSVVLAEMQRIGADLLDEQLAANATSDPIGETVEVWSRAAVRFRALTPTEETADVVDQWLDLTEHYIRVFEEYGPLLRDPTTAQAAVADFLAENTLLANESTLVDADVLRLIITELTSRGDPLGVFLAQLAAERDALSGVTVELFAALEQSVIDPAAFVRSMEGPVAQVAAFGERIAALIPPPSAADLHARQIALIADYDLAFSGLFASIEAGEASPPPDVLRALTRLGAEAPEFNAAYSRFVADVLAGVVI